MSPAKTAELIEIPFRMWSRVSPGKHVLNGGPHPRKERANFEGVLPIEKDAKHNITFFWGGGKR